MTAGRPAPRFQQNRGGRVLLPPSVRPAPRGSPRAPPKWGAPPLPPARPAGRCEGAGGRGASRVAATGQVLRASPPTAARCRSLTSSRPLTSEAYDEHLPPRPPHMRFRGTSNAPPARQQGGDYLPPLCLCLWPPLFVPTPLSLHCANRPCGIGTSSRCPPAAETRASASHSTLYRPAAVMSYPAGPSTRLVAYRKGVPSDPSCDEASQSCRNAIHDDARPRIPCARRMGSTHAAPLQPHPADT